MDARYLKASTVLPYQNKVCGRTLRAFCLRHRVALEAIDSPLLEPFGKQVGADDVILAVRILSSRTKEEMCRPFTLRERLERTLMRHFERRLSYNAGIVVGVIANSMDYPKLWKKDGSKRTHEQLPWPLACVANLCRNGITLEEAWTMPEAEAVWFSISAAIYNGAKVDILSTDEEKELERFDERIAEYKKRMNHN